MNIEHDRVIFSTGKSVYAHRGIIGLAPDYHVTEGYDGGFWQPGDSEYRDDALTPSERVELADYMIERWKTFRDMAHASMTEHPR